MTKADQVCCTFSYGINLSQHILGEASFIHLNLANQHQTALFFFLIKLNTILEWIFIYFMRRQLKVVNKH